MKFYIKNPLDFPRRKRRLAWYVEALCSDLLHQDEITQKDIDIFWGEVKRRETRLPFSWQRENLNQEAEEGLNRILGYYQYDPEIRVYKRREGS